MIKSRPKLLLIRGLGHSGTTILDLALGANPGVIGLGEAARLLLPPRHSDAHDGPYQLRNDLRFKRVCSCGSVAANCSIWGDYLEWLRLNDDFSMDKKVLRLLSSIARSDDDPWYVDSYQDDLSMVRLPSDLFDLRVIHLVRDIRSWLPGRVRADRHKGKPLPSFRNAFRWIYVNQKFSNVFRQSGMPVLRVGYEELALRPEHTLRLICEWLGLAFSTQMLSPGTYSKSHILLGNRVRWQGDRNQQIVYDGSWLAGHDPCFLAFLLSVPLVAKMHRSLVYSNNFL
jgi:hypothetical protein